MDAVQLKKREMRLAVITAVILVSFLVFTIVIDPQLKRHKELSIDMHELNVKLTKMKADMLAKDRIERVYSEIKPFIVAEGTEQQQKSTFTKQLSEIYKKLNVKPRSVKILPIAKEPYYNRISIRIEMTLEIKEFLSFVAGVEASDMPIRIEQFDLRVPEVTDKIHMSMIVSRVVSGDEG